MPGPAMTETRRPEYQRWLMPVGSALAVLCYLTLSLLAFVRYPLHYSPLRNWLSDLGDRNVSPSGAFFYNAGIVLTGLCLVLFYLGLSAWKLEGNRPQQVMLLVAQCCGIVGVAAMIMSAMYSIDQPAAHSAWSEVQRIATGTAFAFSVAALRYCPNCPRWLLGLGVVTVLVNLVVSVFFNTSQILEWPVIGLFLSYVLLLGIVTRRVFAAKAVPHIVAG